MKNLFFQRKLQRMRQYHANQRNSPFDDGVRIFHRYDEFDPDALSWWDDCQIIVGKRRVMIWWTHPRFAYRNAIEEAAWEAVGDEPDTDWLGELRSLPIYKPAGKSRKRIVAHRGGKRDEAYQQWSQRLHAEEDRLAATGIDLTIAPSCGFETLDWCSGLELRLPVEVRDVAELKALAEIGRRLFKREMTIEELFPGYAYGRTQWLAEQAQRESAGRFSQQLLSMPLATPSG